MKLTIAHLVAIQFGLFVGTMSWLVYSRLDPPAEPRTAPVVTGKMVNSIRPDPPVSELKNQRPPTGAYRGDREQGQPVDEQLAQNSPIYYRTVATRPYPRSGFDNTIAVGSPSYPEVVQEPGAVSADYAASTEPVYYVQPTQFIPYYEPIQTVVFSNSRHFGNRGRHALRTCRPQTNPRLTLNTLSSGPSGNRVLSSGPSGNILSSGRSGNVLSRAGAIGPACRPVQGSRPRRNR